MPQKFVATETLSFDFELFIGVRAQQFLTAISECWLKCRNEDASKKIFVATGTLVFDFELFIGVLSWCHSLKRGYWGGDLREGFDLIKQDLPGQFNFLWIHPPYWNIIHYSSRLFGSLHDSKFKRSHKF